MDKEDEYLSQFIRYNKKLFSYILVMIPNHIDAEDVLQETALILWNKFDEFQAGTNFYAWSKQVAKNKIFEYYKSKKSFINVDLSFLQEIQAVNEPVLDDWDERTAALRVCLKKLNARDLNLVKVRFHKNITLRKMAEEANLSVHTVYKRMACVYLMLQRCIRKTMLQRGS